MTPPLAETAESAQLTCLSLTGAEVTRAEFVEECVRLTARTIGCSRAGLWLFVDSEQGRLQRCLGMYDSQNARMCRVPDETERRSMPYFFALESEGHVVAHDVLSHPATRALFSERGASNRVRSLLAAAFSLNGKLYGALTCTQLDSPKRWSGAHLAALRQIGARAALSLANASPRQFASLWGALE